MVICLQQGADLHMTQLMPLPLTGSIYLSGTGLPRYNNNNNDRLTAFDPGQPG